VQVREAQIQQLTSDSQRDFIERLAAAVREIQPETVSDLDHDDLIECVSAGVDRALGHGLVMEDAIGTFVGWMFEFAPNFDQQPNIKMMLEYPGLTPEERLGLVAEAATEEDWTEAEEMYDAAAWGVNPSSGAGGG